MADPAQGPAVEDEGSVTPTAAPLTGAPTTDDDVFAERPELFVGAAFAGGLLLAQILKRVRR